MKLFGELHDGKDLGFSLYSKCFWAETYKQVVLLADDVVIQTLVVQEHK